MPTVPGTLGKARLAAKRTEAGGLGAEDVATAKRRRRRPLECSMADFVEGVLRVAADYDFEMMAGDGVISGHTLYARNEA